MQKKKLNRPEWLDWLWIKRSWCHLCYVIGLCTCASAVQWSGGGKLWHMDGWLKRLFCDNAHISKLIYLRRYRWVQVWSSTINSEFILIFLCFYSLSISLSAGPTSIYQVTLSLQGHGEWADAEVKKKRKKKMMYLKAP